MNECLKTPSTMVKHFETEKKHTDKECQIQIGAVKFKFEDGVWGSDVNGSKKELIEERQALQKENEQLEKEINILRLKKEIILDQNTFRSQKIHSLLDSQKRMFKKLRIISRQS